MEHHCRCTSEAVHANARRIVFTGGPGAGKTAVLEVVRRTMCKHVHVLPEAASIVFGGGFPRRPTVTGRKCAQRAIHHIQVELETLALSESAALVLCDRGVLDGLAYWPGDETEFWQSVGMTRAAALARYDLVIHLRVPTANGGYDFSNPVRTETADEALAVDVRMIDAWRDHPNVVTIHNTADFGEKLERAIEVVANELPACCR